MAKGLYHKWLSPESLTLVEGWAKQGLTEKQIAKNIGISERTLNEWKVRFPQFVHALKKGKEVADFEVENALYKNACGHTVEELVVETWEDGEGRVRTHKRKIQRYIPPNAVSQIFWLKNRKPDVWRDKVNVNVEEDKAIEKAREILGGVNSVIDKDAGGVPAKLQS